MTLDDRLRHADPHPESAAPEPPRHVASAIISGSPRTASPWRGPLLALGAAAAVIVVALAGAWLFGDGSPSTTAGFVDDGSSNSTVATAVTSESSPDSAREELEQRYVVISEQHATQRRVIEELSKRLTEFRNQDPPDNAAIEAIEEALQTATNDYMSLEAHLAELEQQLGITEERGVVPTTTVPTTCSASGMVGPQPQQGLPPEVAATRDTLFNLAAVCNWNVLRHQMPDDFLWSFGGGSPDDAIVDWQRREQNGETVLRSLANMLDTTGTRIESEDETVWIFPAAAAYDSWDDIPENVLAEIQPFLSAEDIAAYRQFGSYGGWRVGIAEDGTWRFFVAGD